MGVASEKGLLPLTTRPITWQHQSRSMSIALLPPPSAQFLDGHVVPSLCQSFSTASPCTRRPSALAQNHVVSTVCFPVLPHAIY